MLVLISFGLVLVAAVTLVAGIVADSLPLIYVSIASSVGAGVVLVIAVVTGRPSVAPGVEGPAPLEEAPPEPVVPAGPATKPTPAVPGRQAASEEYFPIADYDDLNVDEITPLLDQLDAEELEMVRERERAGSDRVTILRHIDELLESEEVWAADGEPAEYFPIADYDDLNVSDINPLLEQLDDDELEMVREREQAGAGRVTILRQIDDLLGEAEEPAPAKKKAAAKKRGGKKKAAAKRKAAAKKKAPAKKRAAKKAPAKKRGGKKKAAAKKRGGKKKAAAKKRGARR